MKINKRLEKIINMSRKGTKNEKANAIRIIKNICKNKNLDFKDLMKINIDVRDYDFEYSGLLRKKITFQIYFKIIGGKSVYHNSFFIFFKTTKEKFIEFKNAFETYRKLYKKERKKMLKRQKEERTLFADAFIERHDLYSNPTKEEIEEQIKKRKFEKITAEDIRKAKMRSNLADDMDEEAVLYKRLETK